MPDSLQTLDTSFPKIDNHQTTEENFLQVTNYLYMLLENLRYTLGNLGEENFNDTELDDIAKMIREPIMVQLKDTEGRVANLGIEAARLSARLEDAEGNINAFNATAAGWYARIEDAEGNISNLSATSQLLSSQISSLDGTVSNIQQTANTLTTRIQTAEGDISSLTQTTSSLSTKISDAEGNLSSLTQTVNGMTLSVSNSGTSSTIKLMQNGVAVSSQSITMSGYVTFTDLSSPGSTTINGANISTGYLSADRIDGGTLTGVTFIAKGTPSSGLRNITIEDGEIRVGDTILCEDTDGHTQLSNYEGSISISCPYYINLSGGLGVTINRLVMDNGKYWAFSSSGIGFYDASGTPISHVQLVSGAP